MASAPEPMRQVFDEPEFRNLFRWEIRRATRYQDFLSFCLVRPEHPGAPNPRVLQAVAEQLADLLRSTDVVGRLGDDIGLLLLHTPDTDAAPILERVRAHVEATIPARDAEASVAVILHMALTSFPSTATTDAALLAGARERLLEIQSGEHRTHQPPPL